MVLGSSGECVEKCGDGLNFGLLQCDDGNLAAGDGCSPACQVESDWTCSGGTPE
jgi:cysteine-rich repeat protein